jgi:hypothetical protein
MPATQRFELWSPALRRAVMSVCPAFFSWPAQDQLKYRMHLPERVRDDIAKQLLASIQSDKTLHVLHALNEQDRQPLDLQHQLNEKLLPLEGIGEDAFYLNEYLGEGTSLLDFQTLRDFDEHDHQFQESARADENKAHIPQPYLGALYGRWARVLVGGRLTSLTLSMAAGYIYDQISTAAADELQRLMPHRYVSGPDNGKSEDGMIRWDMFIDASGQEAMLDELQRRIWDQEQRQWAELRTRYDALDQGRIYMIDTSSDGESSIAIVFSDKSALDSVKLDTFMADCRSNQSGEADLLAEAAVEAKRICTFIAEQHDDLQRHFDPKVVPLRKRRKVLMHPGMLDDLA